MISVIFNWFYIAFTTFCLGFGFACFAEKVLGYRIRKGTCIFMAGFVIATVYAEVFSLFYRVNVEANLVMILVCICIAVMLRRRMLTYCRETISSTAVWEKVLTAALFLAWSYFVTRGYCVPDMNLYHGQSIRWIEEYGVVKGQGLVHFRFAYNSSVFAASALYSLSFVLGRPMHAVNGWLAFLLSLEALRLGKCFSAKKMRLSDFARVALVYYCTLIWDEVVAPSSDYAAMFMVFFIVIQWLGCLEDKKERENITPYCLLCVVGAFALSLKLTASLILVLLLKPAIRLIREKRLKEIAIYLCLGLAAALPWMIRTVMICGWLFYPFTAIDLFNVEWKLWNEGMINSDAKLIAAWARGTRELGVDIPLLTWYPLWFENELFATERVLILGDLAACLWTVGYGAVTLVRKKKEQLDEFLVLLTMTVCFGFWQISAPMMRYGYAYVLLLLFLCVGTVLHRLFRDKKLVMRIVYAAFLLLGCYKLWVGVKYVWDTKAQPYYVWQVDFVHNASTPFEVGNAVFYKMEPGYPPGYETFPVIAEEAEEFELIGDSIRDGFRMVR